MKKIFLFLLLGTLSFATNLDFNTDKKNHISDMKGYYEDLGISIIEYQNEWYLLRDINISDGEIKLMPKDKLTKTDNEYIWYNKQDEHLDFYSWDTKKKMLVRIRVEDKDRTKRSKEFYKKIPLEIK